MTAAVPALSAAGHVVPPAFPLADEAPPLPVELASLPPLRDAADASQIVQAVAKMRGTAADADLLLAAFFRLLALDRNLSPAFSFLLSQLIDAQD